MAGREGGDDDLHEFECHVLWIVNHIQPSQWLQKQAGHALALLATATCLVEKQFSLVFAQQ